MLQPHSTHVSPTSTRFCAVPRVTRRPQSGKSCGSAGPAAKRRTAAESASESKHSYTVPSGASVDSLEESLEDEGPPLLEMTGLNKRKTKMVCTIGPGTSDRTNLFALADAGMDVARLNMSHGDHTSHKEVVELIKEYKRTWQE